LSDKRPNNRQQLKLTAPKGGCRLVDKFARDFKCGKDEVKVIGETGTAVG
jgi:hypothetical protein